MASVMLIWCLPAAFQEITDATVGQIGIVISLGIFPSALAYFAWTKAIRLAVNTGRLANYMYLTPLLALLLAFFIFRDMSGTETFIGG